MERAEELLCRLKKKYPSLGGYAGRYEAAGLKLAATCDGVGTKIKLASLTNRHSGIGVDLVAMSINDIIAAGARPLFFLDYFACGKLDDKIFLQVMEGIENGVKKADCLLLGGETAEMPGMYREGEYDLAGFAVGEIKREFSARNIKSGDKIIGYPSSGIHSNGFSLIRKIFSKEEIKENASILLKPTLIYSKLIEPPSGVKNLAHVTGGGVVRALKRLLGEDKKARIKEIPFKGIYSKIKDKGVSRSQMKEVFNCGWGMLAVSDKENALSFASATGGELIGEVL